MSTLGGYQGSVPGRGNRREKSQELSDRKPIWAGLLCLTPKMMGTVRLGLGQGSVPISVVWYFFNFHPSSLQKLLNLTLKSTQWILTLEKSNSPICKILLVKDSDIQCISDIKKDIWKYQNQVSGHMFICMHCIYCWMLIILDNYQIQYTTFFSDNQNQFIFLSMWKAIKIYFLKMYCCKVTSN